MNNIGAPNSAARFITDGRAIPGNVVVHKQSNQPATIRIVDHDKLELLVKWNNNTFETITAKILAEQFIF